MSLRSTLGIVRRHTLCSFHRRLVKLETPRPIVSVCFDDFPSSAYTVGGAILRDFGALGTYYVAVGLMDQSNDLGQQFRTRDLYGLVEDGHELANHTFSHVSSRSVSLAAFRRDVQKGQGIIRDMGLAPSTNFAYPYGEVTLAAKRALGEEMGSCRSIYNGINGPLVDLNLLFANALYGDSSCFAATERLIAQNEERRGWLIFYTHDVSENPSPFGCTPALLESAISCAVRRGLSISTISQVLAELRPRVEGPS
jgi:peptidoglycan/xylan/chitin deacetylase (PgdA/CDA1 family)